MRAAEVAFARVAADPWPGWAVGALRTTQRSVYAWLHVDAVSARDQSTRRARRDGLFVRTLGAFLFATLCAGCNESCGSTDDLRLRTRPARWEASDRVDAPEGSRWTQAWVSASLEEVSYGRLGTQWRLEYDLLLAGQGAGMVSLSTYRSGDSDAESVNAEASADYRVRFAPDAHAVAVAKDDSTSWRYVALDIDDEPFTHWEVGEFVTPSEDADPWAHAPSTSAFVGKLFQHIEAGGDPRYADVLRTTAYACRHTNDGDLAARLMDMMLSHSKTIAIEAGPDVERKEREQLKNLRDCLCDIARSHVVLRTKLSQVFEKTSASERARANALAIMTELGGEPELASMVRVTSSTLAARENPPKAEPFGDFADALAVAVATHMEAGKQIPVDVRQKLVEAALLVKLGATARGAVLRAASGLDGDSAAEFQREVAAALSKATQSSPCTVAELTWALARSVRRHGSLDVAVEKILMEVAGQPDPPREQACSAVLLEARGYAMLGLGALSSNTAKKTIAKWAKMPCLSPLPFAVDDKPFWESPAMRAGSMFETACWARAVAESPVREGGSR
jgi:hypothetical protein